MNLQQLCENAALVGQSLDLTDCHYGPHKRTRSFLGVQTYYHFLAGFVRHLHLRQILEIGTSYGGSMMAMHRGCLQDEAGVQLVTIDKIDMAGKGLTRLAQVQRIHGDSLAPETLRKTRARLSVPIDLLYIDSKHDYDHTQRNIAIFGCCFHPRFIILDDIHLNAEMETLWSEIQDRYGRLAYDASEIAERPSGFGILACAAERLIAPETKPQPREGGFMRRAAVPAECQPGR